ncbi:prepilin-type N-terminal cleavage/methylation domain-containing protein [Alkalibacter mobilis]|uniref:prepilin-type N-terminal cleavage/methylation domain-containing protein n=1 Tax=Alkalibacter mobilis TaxID=2787712 RepID=UPI00189CB03D|nr:prepilin-type N-terminal cleavage/methylation domain-containing protein [Alkalibacter mobilis]MBF7095520.1 prepilin-type N-terminal cleavage/methylation domain-containing protein [Alkalibacter mobilis]
MNKFKKNNRASGFTIVEIIVSIMIISILLIAGLYMLSMSITSIANEGEDTTLLYEAQHIMENVTGKPLIYNYADGQEVYSGSEGKLYFYKSADIMDLGGIGTVSGTMYTIKSEKDPGVQVEVLRSFVPD